MLRPPSEVVDLARDFIQATALVAQFFHGDAEKTIAWFETPNPLLGVLTPLRYALLKSSAEILKFVKTELGDNPPSEDAVHDPDLRPG